MPRRPFRAPECDPLPFCLAPLGRPFFAPHPSITYRIHLTIREHGRVCINIARARQVLGVEGTQCRRTRRPRQQGQRRRDHQPGSSTKQGRW